MHFFQSLPKFCCTLVFLLGFYFITSPAQASNAPSSIAVFDWTIAEALLSLDPAPVLMGNVAAFHTWTGNDYVDADITNIGTRSFPNMELLSSIDPQYILLAPRQTRMAATLANIAPSYITHSFPFVNNSSDELWATFDAFILEVGELSGRRASAEQLITNTKLNLASLKDELDPHPPLLVIQLITEQYVRVYGDNSMFNEVLHHLGLNNAWTGKTNQWGYSMVSIRELFKAKEARLVIMESAFPIGIENNIENSGMWRYLPSVQRGDFIVLPSSFWIGGVHPSARRFANALVKAL